MNCARRLTVVLLGAAMVACGESTPSPATGTPEGDGVIQGVREPSRPAPAINRVTPILAVEAIEPVVPFWEALGFTAINPSRQDGHLVFVAFAKDGVEVHYQTLARIERDLPGARTTLAGASALVYVNVSDIDAVIERLGGTEIVIPRRQTAWGSDEIYVREPGGHVIGFAAFGGS